ncbi:MAG: PAS domain S-box protein [Bacillota bacterium]
MGDEGRGLKAVVDSMPDIIFTLDGEQRYTGIFGKWPERFGLSREYFLGRRARELLEPDLARAHEEASARALTGEDVVYEWSVTGEGGTYFFQISLSPLLDAGGVVTGVVGIGRDVTELKRAQARIKKLNRLYALLSDVNQTIVRSRNPGEIMRETCRLAVEKGGIRAVWFGLVNEETGSLELAVHAGTGNLPLDPGPGSSYDPRSCSTVRLSLEEGAPRVCSPLGKKGCTAPWHGESTGITGGSAAAFPLLVFGEVKGALVLWATDPDFFDEEESHVMDEMARDISFAMEFDMSEKKRCLAEEELLKSQQERTLILDSLTELVTYYDLDMRIIWANLEAREYMGLGPQGYIGRRCYQVWRNQEGPCEDCCVIEAMRLGGVRTQETVTPDGRSWQVIGNPVRDAEGNIIGGLEVAFEVTQQKKAEKALQESQEQYRTLFERTSNPILVMDSEGNYVDGNEAALHFFECTREELLSRNIKDMVWPGKRGQGAVEAFLRMVKRGGRTEIEHCVNGRAKTMDLTATPGVWGETPVVLGVGTDTTARRWAEEETKRNKARLESLVEIFQYKSNSIQGLLEFTLEEALKLTGSKIGFLYNYAEDRREFTLNARSEGVIVECKTAQRHRHVYTLEEPGFWAEAVRQRKPVILNDFEAPDPLKKGLPKGHARLERFMAIPVFSEDRIVAVVGMGNKESDYDQTDVLQLTLLMDAAWKVVERTEAEKALRRSETQYRAVARLSADFSYSCVHTGSQGYKVDWITDAFFNLTGYSRDDLQEQHCWLFAAHPEDRDAATEALDRLAPGESDTREFRILTKDGRALYITNYTECVEDPEDPRGLRLYGAVRDISERRLHEETLRASEEKYRLLADNTVDCIWMMTPDLVFQYVNPSIEQVTGYTPEEWQGTRLTDHVDEENARLIMAEISRNMARSLIPSSVTREVEVIHKGGHAVPVEITGRILLDENDQPVGLQGVARDITERKLAEETLRQSEALKTSIIEAMPDTLIRFDQHGRYLDVFTQDDSKLYMPRSSLLGKTVDEVLPRELASKVHACLDLALETGELQALEYCLETPAGVLDFEARLKASGNGEVVACVRDITERKRYEEQLQYVSLHDQLTGLYNRAYFEEELKRLGGSREFPITIISADLDGLKLVNDTMGHDKGDLLLVATMGILKDSLRASDILARVGGDEFVALLPRTGPESGESVAERIRQNIALYNQDPSQLPLSVSLGVATLESRDTPLSDTYKRADDLMYRDKLQRSASARGRIIQTLMAALAERDFITEGHAKRLLELCSQVGKKIGLTSPQMANLSLLAQVHDLGKVGTPDRILFKKSPLNDKEWEIMRQHPEVGYRIASSSPDLVGIADLILKHHERWDGTGYPLGLKGEEIPLECRILAIVDAFDTMTSDRPYSKTKGKEEALRELQGCAGTQFDPELVEVFLSV